MDNLTLANTMLANTLRDALVEKASTGKFKSIVASVLDSPSFRKALKGASALFGETGLVAPIRRKKAKKAHKRVAAKKSVDPNAPKKPRGRPKGSKNKPKPTPTTPPAESRPAVAPETESGLNITDLELASETV